MTDADLFARYRALYSSLVSDCAEALGLGVRALAGGLEPQHADALRVVVGRAHTALVRRTDERVDIEGLLAMVDATPADAVVVVATDALVPCALWGGLLSGGVAARGALGAVVDGGVRDLHQIAALGFPVWAAFRSPLDIRGRGETVGHGLPVSCRGVRVEPGDLVLADANGVVVVPRAAEAEVLALCEEKLRGEAATERALRDGLSLSETYARFGAI